ncbi:hypothetical protein DL96DRAFT_1619249 [Flagelloscypha sp. PMI_526]|nr:hypothetical protein DL96DRAFT_1619249 [Flagelloscypha sp. PMI_526]
MLLFFFPKACPVLATGPKSNLNLTIMSIALPHDVLVRILEHADPTDIISSLRVCHTWFKAGKSILYRCLRLQHLSSSWESARQDQYRLFVETLILEENSDFDLDVFPSLCGLSLPAASYPLKIHQLIRLKCLTVQSNIFAGLSSPLLHLLSLTVHSPTRDLLTSLPNVLESAQSLRTLRFIGNCGSITPGTLKSIANALLRPLEVFSLGLSYSLMDKDVFSFLEIVCSNLQELNLVYYLQQNTPRSHQCKFPELRTFNIMYNDPVLRTSQARHLCTWTRRLITHSPRLKSLLITPSSSWYEDGDPILFTSPVLDSLVEHLAAKHYMTLTCLVLGGGLSVGMHGFRTVMKMDLEKLELTVAPVVFYKHLSNSSLSHNLHTFRVNLTPDKRYKALCSDEDVLLWMRNGEGNLRRVQLGSSAWEGQWEVGKGYQIQQKFKNLRKNETDVMGHASQQRLVGHTESHLSPVHLPALLEEPEDEE